MTSNAMTTDLRLEDNILTMDMVMRNLSAADIAAAMQEKGDECDTYIEDTDSAVSSESLKPRSCRTAPVQYPTVKEGRYSKDRRYIPIAKASEAGKVHSSGGKGAKHKKSEKALNQSILPT